MKQKKNTTITSLACSDAHANAIRAVEIDLRNEGVKLGVRGLLEAILEGDTQLQQRVAAEFRRRQNRKTSL